MNMKKNTSSYEDALRELQVILDQLQNNEIPMDDLVQKVKRATTLIKYCKEKLRPTEEEVNKLFK